MSPFDIEEGDGLPHLVWNKVLDAYLEGVSLTPDEYEEMNAYQRYTINEIKKHHKRHESKHIRNQTR